MLADLGDGVPDGICIDADDAVWYADIPKKPCVRVRKGGKVLQSVTVDRDGFASMLGGEAKKMLYPIATEWRGMDKIAEVAWVLDFSIRVSKLTALPEIVYRTDYPRSV